MGVLHRALYLQLSSRERHAQEICDLGLAMDGQDAGSIFIVKFNSKTQVSGRLGMSGGRSPRHAQNPLSASEGKRSQ